MNSENGTHQLQLFSATSLTGSLLTVCWYCHSSWTCHVASTRHRGDIWPKTMLHIQCLLQYIDTRNSAVAERLREA